MEFIGYSWNKFSDWVIVRRKIRDDSLFYEGVRGSVSDARWLVDATNWRISGVRLE